MKKFLSLIGREFGLFFNNNVLRLLFIGAPILYGVLIGSVYQKGKITDLPIIVVDEDRSPMSSKLIEMLNENETIHIAEILGSMVNSKNIATEHEATTVVRIPKGFAADIQQSRLPELAVFVDGSNTLTSNTAMMAVNVVAATMKAGIQIESSMKKGTPKYVAEQQYEPFKTTFIKQNIKSGNYLYFMMPGVLLTVFQQVLLLGLALSFASEFEKGTFSELVSRVSNPIALVLVKIIPYMLMSVGIILMYWGFAAYYKMPLDGDIPAFAWSTFVFILAVCGIGVLVSVVLPNQLKATEVLMVVATPSFILSGFTWPLSQMPAWVQWVADVIPLTHYLKIFRHLYIEKVESYHILGSLNALYVIAAATLTATVVILHFKIKKMKKTVTKTPVA